jgi:hypothetical protein
MLREIVSSAGAAAHELGRTFRGSGKEGEAAYIAALESKVDLRPLS